MAHLLRALAVAGIAATPLALADAAPLYRLTDLGTLGGTLSTASLANINNAGQITGYSTIVGNSIASSNLRAFLWDGTMHDIGAGPGSQGNGINDAGVVVGTNALGFPPPGSPPGTPPPGFPFAFYFDGTVHNLGVGEAQAINSSGTIVFGDTFGINDLGQTTGWSSFPDGLHAFLDDGTMHDLGTFGGVTSRGYNVNNSGVVTGYADVVGDSTGHPPGSVTHAFVYDGTMHDIGTLGGTNSYGSDINNLGVVVGNSNVVGDGTYHAMLWDRVMHDLNTMIDPTDPLYGDVLLTLAQGINDSGQISAEAHFANGDVHEFLLTPTSASTAVPTPGTLALIIVGLAGLACIQLEARAGVRS